MIDRVDPALRPGLECGDPAPAFSRANLARIRGLSDARWQERPVYGRTEPREHAIDTPEGRLKLFVFQGSGDGGGRPALLWFHGGGYVMGKGRDMWMGPLFAERAGCTVISVEYRLAPEDPFPAAVLDALNALRWLHREAEALGIDPGRVAVGGASAGGGLAAGLCHFNLSGDRLPIRFQLLLYPMLDNLHATPSGRHPGHPVWTREMSLAAWEMYLGGTPGANAPPSAAPARAVRLAGLPPAFISVGEVDLFFDESRLYAERLCAAGVPCCFSAYPGMYHGGEMDGAGTALGARMIHDYVAALVEGVGGARTP